jgi:hypothetical protein
MKEEKHMTKRLFLLFSVISMAVASAGSAFKIELQQASVVNGTNFKAGEAKIEIKDNKEVVIHQGKTMAEAPVKVEENKIKYVYTTVGYKDNGQIKDICVAGTTTHIFFE